MNASRTVAGALFGVLSLGLAPTLSAQEVTWEGQLRPRTEWRDPVTGGDDAAFFTSMRTRIGAAVTLSERLRSHLQLQDVRLWGEETNTLGDFSADQIDLHQGWLEADFFSGRLALRVGRQEVSLGEQRLVGAVDWTQQGRAFDGLRARSSLGPLTLDLLAFQIAEESAATQSRDAAFLGAYGRHPLGGRGEGDFYLLAVRDGTTAEYTAGTRLQADLEILDLRIETAYQAGERTGSDLAAWMVALRAGRRLTESLRLDLGYEVLSGDDDAADSEIGTFSTLFATNHAFYGQADLFTDIPAHTGGRGLRDLWLRVGWIPVDGWRSRIDLHRFTTQTGGADDDFADELDLSVSGPLVPGLTWTTGASWVTPGEALRALDRLDEDQYFFFLMLDARF